MILRCFHRQRIKAGSKLCPECLANGWRAPLRVIGSEKRGIYNYRKYACPQCGETFEGINDNKPKRPIAKG